MLEKQMWMKYGPDLYCEWKQARDEGRRVEELEGLCQKTAELAAGGDYERMAKLLGRKLMEAPVREDYPYREPSDLEGIRRERPAARHSFHRKMDRKIEREKLEGAWIGRISGCLLGKPVEGLKREKLYAILKQTDNYPMHKYIREAEFTQELKEEIGFDSLEPWQKSYADRIGGAAPADDDTNYTVLALRILERYGRQFRPNDVLEAWLTWMPMFSACSAERAAYRNAAAGLCAPQTALVNNPFREWIGAQIRGDFYGYINPAQPRAAAEMAWRDACISHVKNGIYGEMFVAAMLAAAAVCSDVKTVLEAGLDEIPAGCRLREEVERVISWHEDGVGAEEAIERIHERYDEYDGHDWCHTNSNAMIVAAALLYGEKDFGRTICLAVQAAFDTDCNGATAGSVVGMMLGKQGIPQEWYACYQKKLETGISGCYLVTVEELADRTVRLMEQEAQDGGAEK